MMPYKERYEIAVAVVVIFAVALMLAAYTISKLWDKLLRIESKLGHEKTRCRTYAVENDQLFERLINSGAVQQFDFCNASYLAYKLGRRAGASGESKHNAQ